MSFLRLKCRKITQNNSHSDPLHVYIYSMSITCVITGVQHDVVVLDVAGSEDATDTINCPPQIFLQTAFLGQVHQILKPTG